MIPHAPTAPSPTPALATVGERLRQCRHLRGLTQAELASRAGLNQTTISMIEVGNRGLEMSVDTIWRLAWCLGTSIDFLAGMPALRG